MRRDNTHFHPAAKISQHICSPEFTLVRSTSAIRQDHLPPTEDISVYILNESLEQIVSEPVAGPTTEPIKAPTKEPTEELSEQPIEEPSEQPLEKTVYNAWENPKGDTTVKICK